MTQYGTNLENFISDIRGLKNKMAYDINNLKLDKRFLRLADSDKVKLPRIKAEKGILPASIEILIDNEKIVLGMNKVSCYEGEDLAYFVEYKRVFEKRVEQLEITVSYGAPFTVGKIRRDYRFKLGRTDDINVKNNI
jgi:hypothetical protein